MAGKEIARTGETSPSEIRRVLVRIRKALVNRRGAMAINLVSLVMEFLTPDMIGRIASALGIDRNKTLAGVGAAVPGLLAGLSGVATQPGGAQKLVDAVRQQSGALGSFANMIGASGQS